MRKRHLYRQAERSSSKIPTIIIMCVILFAILYYGKSMSEHVAKVFVPDAPQIDVPMAMSPSLDEPQPSDAIPDVVAGTHSHAGTFIYHAHRNAVGDLLKLLAVPHSQGDDAR